MTITEFLQTTGFSPHATVANSWDSFSPDGKVLMQLWGDMVKRVKGHHPDPRAYLRVGCFNAKHYAEGSNRIGYGGRLKALDMLREGAEGYVAISAIPDGMEHGVGVWAKYSDLSKVYPILSVERDEATGDQFVVVGAPIKVEELMMR